jgi:L-rhamnose-H+ transport protein
LSIRKDLSLPASALSTNVLMAAAGGVLWYLQFFFLAWGGASIPAHLAYVNWMLLMSGCVFCAAIVGLAAGEWGKIFSKPVYILALGLLFIIVAANIVGIGMAL